MTCRFWRNSLPKQMKFVRSDPTDFEWGNFTTALVCVCLIWGKVKTTETDTLAWKWTDCVLFPSMDHTEIIFVLCLMRGNPVNIFWDVSTNPHHNKKPITFGHWNIQKSNSLFISIFYLVFKFTIVATVQSYKLQSEDNLHQLKTIKYHESYWIEYICLQLISNCLQ